jgi:hypothetical protein
MGYYTIWLVLVKSFFVPFWESTHGNRSSPGSETLGWGTGPDLRLVRASRIMYIRSVILSFQAS